jgi:hypothetical protein
MDPAIDNLSEDDLKAMVKNLIFSTKKKQLLIINYSLSN